MPVNLVISTDWASALRLLRLDFSRAGEVTGEKGAMMGAGHVTQFYEVAPRVTLKFTCSSCDMSHTQEGEIGSFHHLKEGQQIMCQ